MEDSSVPYRAFLRSGSYPALTQRVMRSGGVLAQAAGWFALVVTAASGGYNLTQRLVTPSAAAASPALVRPAARPLLAIHAGMAQPSEPVAVERVEDVILPDGIAAVDERATAASSARAADKAPRKRSGAVAPSAASLSEAAEPTGEGAPQRSEPVAAEAITALATTAAEPATVSAATAPDAIDAALRDSAARQRAALAEARVTAKPKVTSAPDKRPAPSLPLLASARVDNVAVRGPLSAAQLRRSVDRVRPMLSDCYGDAARRAGHNHFSQVRIGVTIDEAGRVKTLPLVEGAQLPGLEACLRSAMSKLVCQAPDTGTAKAQIFLRFAPER